MDNQSQNPRDLFDLTGRVACVTGASAGLGQRAAIALAAAGARVVGVARRSDQLADWVAATGQNAAAVTADLSRREDIADIALRIAAPFGPPDIVVHAAGINTREAADDVTPAGWDMTLNLNLAAPFFLTQALAPAMKAKGWGRVVNFASLQTTRAFPQGIAYGASKAGIAQLTRAMAEAWSPSGITANAIGPGFFPTELTGPVFADPDRAARNAAQTCIGRNGALEDIDGPLLFLCSDASAYVTGQVLMVDGVYREMKALVYDAVETLVYRDMPDPAAAPGQSLIRIEASGICGSDMHAYLGHDDRRPAPLILGHEAAGRIVGGSRDGERVTINPLVSCGTCRACKSGRDNLCAQRMIISMPPREGAFAEMVVMRDENLVIVPDDVPLRKAALAEPLACGWHAVRLGASVLDMPLADATCHVIGGGAIGVGAALALRAFGATRITVAEPNATRRATLDKIDGFDAVAPGDVTSADFVIDGVGYAATRADATAITQPGGVIMHIGLGENEGGLDIRRMTLQEIAVIGTYTYTAQDFRDTAAAIFDGRLGMLDWTEQRDLADGQQAFADIRAGKVAAPKIILEPDHV